jgi:Fic family protein
MSQPYWNWQQSDWPRFRYDPAHLKPLEDSFWQSSGTLLGASMHLDGPGTQWLKVGLMSDEALKTSEIEGELLNRDSLQSSIQRQLGLAVDRRKVTPAEAGVAEMTVDLYQHYNRPLSAAMLFHWHRLLMNGRIDLKDLGRYRRDPEPMQVVSGPLHDPKVHFEAPPANSLKPAMDAFIAWFNRTGPNGSERLSPLARAGIAHHYFVSLHPFEDGNGRIARSLAEKALAQALGRPSLLALSHTIQAKRKAYYDILEANNKNNAIDGWLEYFAKTAVQAQARSIGLVEFLLAKARFFERHRSDLNERQAKAVARVLQEGPEGFKGGLSAQKYVAITKTSRATATRDLQEMVEKRILEQQGSGKGTRYQLNLKH